MRRRVIKKFERLQAIKEITEKHKFIQITDAVNKLNTSESTIRRDIKELEDQGYVILSQGSIIWNDKKNQYRENIYYRQAQNLEPKKKIAMRALDLIVPEETIFIGTGTTMLEMVKNLPDDIPLSIVTNDLEIALSLENKYNITTIMLGGVVKRGTHTVVGNMANDILNNIYFQKVFLSPAGITEEGFSFLNIQAMEIREKVVKNCEKMIMVSDSSKFGKRSTVTGFSLSQCDTLITENCPEEWYVKISDYMKIIIA